MKASKYRCETESKETCSACLGTHLDHKPCLDFHIWKNRECCYSQLFLNHEHDQINFVLFLVVCLRKRISRKYSRWSPMASLVWGIARGLSWINCWRARWSARTYSVFVLQRKWHGACYQVGQHSLWASSLWARTSRRSLTKAIRFGRS